MIGMAPKPPATQIWCTQCEVCWTDRPDNLASRRCWYCKASDHVVMPGGWNKPTDGSDTAA